MADINLSLIFDHPGAVAHRVRYARIDNVLSPVYTTVVPDVTSSPATIATVPNGQYSVLSRPIYNDLRVCEEAERVTAACPGLISVNAYINGGNLIIQYVAPSDVPQVRFTVSYPNGGSTIRQVVNDGNDVAVALPSNLYGDFSVSGQSVCDPDTGFYSEASTQVTVSRSNISATAVLYLYFLRGLLNAFNAYLSSPVSGNITINQMFADGYSDTGCATEVASSNRTTSVTINTGNVSTGVVTPTVTSGDWSTATKYTMYNVNINGSPVSNGDVITVGSDSVVISIPSCVP
jgi:hypothetical protein